MVMVGHLYTSIAQYSTIIYIYCKWPISEEASEEASGGEDFLGVNAGALSEEIRTRKMSLDCEA
jgi:hypothetical protein